MTTAESDVGIVLADPDLLSRADPRTLAPLVQRLVNDGQVYDDIGRIAMIYATAFRASPHTFTNASPETRRWLLAVHEARFTRGPSPVTLAPWRIAWAEGMQENRQVQSPWLNMTGVATTMATGMLGGRPAVAVGYDDSTVRVWDLATGAPVGRPILLPIRVAEDHSAIAVGEADGRSVVVTNGFDQTRVWDLETGRCEVLGPRRVYSVAITVVDGRPILVMGGDGSVHVWSLRTRKAVHGMRLTAHEGPVRALAVARVGGRPVAVSGGEDGSVRLWDLRSGASRPMASTRDAACVRGVVVGSIDGRSCAVSGADDGTAKVWDLKAGRAWGRPLTGHKGPVTAVALAHTGRHPVAITGGEDGTARLWDLRSRSQRDAPLWEHTGPVWSVAAASVHGRPVVLAGSGDPVRIRGWDITDRAAWEHTPAARTPVVAMAAGDPGSDAMVVAMRDDPRVGKDLRVDVRTGERRPGLWIGIAERRVRAITIGSVQGQPVAITGDADGAIRLWGAHEAERGHRTGPMTGHAGQVLALAMIQMDGASFVASGGEDGTVRIWALERHAALGTLVGHEGPVAALAVVERDSHPLVASAGEDGTVRLWDPRTGEPVGRALRGHRGPVRALASGAVGGTPVLASGGGDGTVRIWDAAAGRIVRSVRTDHDGAVAAVALARMSGRPVIITGGDDGTVRMWDSRDGRRIGAHAVFPWPVGPLAWTESGILVVAVGSELVAITLA